jgi:hypothetical protein
MLSYQLMHSLMVLIQSAQVATTYQLTSVVQGRFCKYKLNEWQLLIWLSIIYSLMWPEYLLLYSRNSETGPVKWSVKPRKLFVISLILCLRLRLDFQNGIFPSVFATSILYNFKNPPPTACTFYISRPSKVYNPNRFRTRMRSTDMKLTFLRISPYFCYFVD